VQTLCAAQGGHGAWSGKGDILFFVWGVQTTDALRMVRESGGAIRTVTDEKLGWAMWPSFLPDDRHFVFFRLGLPERTGIWVGSLDNPAEERMLFKTDARGEVHRGELFHVRDAVLLRQQFDLKRLAVAGEAVPVAQAVFNFTYTGSASFSVSDDARTIVWQRSALPTQLLWRDFAGRELGRVGDVDTYRNFTLSPDGHRIAADLFDRNKQTIDIWIIDADRGVKTRMTSSVRGASTPVWMNRPDTLAISAADPQHPSDAPDLALLTLSDGTIGKFGHVQGVKYPTSVTASGNIIYTVNRGKRRQIEMIPSAGGQSTPLGSGKYDEGEAMISPDQRWLAFESDESGRPEIYIQPFGRVGEKVRVSAAGGAEPQWAVDGSAVFFINSDGNLIKADVDGRDQLRVIRSTSLFRISSAGMMEFESLGQRHYAVARDRILVRELPGGDDADPVTVLLNVR